MKEKIIKKHSPKINDECLRNSNDYYLIINKIEDILTGKSVTFLDSVFSQVKNRFLNKNTI